MANSNTKSLSVGLFTMVLCFCSGHALANPEIGGDTSRISGDIPILSTNYANPMVLKEVTVACPVDGFLVAQADANFSIVISPPGADGILVYGITTGTALDRGDYHFLESHSANGQDYESGAISRFDTCIAGQTVRYRFVAYLRSNLSLSTYAQTPTLSVIHLAYRY